MIPMYRHSETLTDIADLLKTMGYKSKNVFAHANGAMMEVEDTLMHHKYYVSMYVVPPPKVETVQVVKPASLIEEIEQWLKHVN